MLRSDVQMRECQVKESNFLIEEENREQAHDRSWKYPGDQEHCTEEFEPTWKAGDYQGQKQAACECDCNTPKREHQGVGDRLAENVIAANRGEVLQADECAAFEIGDLPVEEGDIDRPQQRVHDREADQSQGRHEPNRSRKSPDVAPGQTDSRQSAQATLGDEIA